MTTTNTAERDFYGNQTIVVGAKVRGAGDHLNGTVVEITNHRVKVQIPTGRIITRPGHCLVLDW